MNLLDSIRALVGRGGEKNRAGKDEERILDRDEEGNARRESDVVAALYAELARRREERRPLEAQWTLNANFLSGNQNCDIQPETGEVQTFSPRYEYEEAGVFNRIAPLIETRLASLRALSYRMTVRPASDEADDCEKSEVATRLLRFLQQSTDFEAKKDTLLLWSELCGTAFVLSCWDKDAGADVSLPDLEDDGVSAHMGGAVCREGDLRYGILSPYEVFPESIYRQNVGDQGSILIEQVMTVDAIRDTYGVTVAGGTADTFALAPIAGSTISGHPGTTVSLAGRRAEDSAPVLTYMEKANARHPAGVLAVVAGDKLVWYSDLPYDEIPLVALKCREVAGQFFGRSVIADLIPLQRAYNGTKNKIHDYIRAVAANPLLVPEGTIPDIEDFTTHGLPPGEILEYNAERGKPEPLSPAPLPAELRYECERLASDMEYTAGVSQLMVVGKTPTGVTSGTAIESLRAIDNTRLALTGENLRDAVRRLAVIWLKICKRYVTGARTLRIVGENGAAAVSAFCSDDINSFDLVFDAENELIVSPEAQKQNFLTALNLGLFNDENGRLPHAVKARALHMMKMGNYEDTDSLTELQIRAAERENATVAAGGAITPGLFDDHDLHIETHKKFLLQARFESLRRAAPERAAMLEEHIFAHEIRRAGGEAHHAGA